MTLTEDELARLAELEDLLTVGLVEQPINGSVLSWGEAALIAHRIGRHLLRASPVADTAGEPPPPRYDSDEEWSYAHKAHSLTGRWPAPASWSSTSNPVADTAGIDAAWQEAVAALPEGVKRAISIGQYPPDHESAGDWVALVVYAPHFYGDGPTVTAALLALAAALR